LTLSHVLLRETRNIRLLDLADGDTRWQRTSPTPVVSVQVVGEMVLICADRLNALSLGNGSQQWQVALRGARVAGAHDGALIIAATDGEVTAFDAGGAVRWRLDVPGTFAAGLVDDVSADAHTAYVTFKPRDDRRDPLDLDVLAIALDNQATRP
jgi:outer membrane protein assembly factor BamB